MRGAVLLLLLLLLLLLTTCAGPTPEPPPPPVHDVEPGNAAHLPRIDNRPPRTGKYLGVALALHHLDQDVIRNTLRAYHVTSFTAEAEMKMQYLWPERGRWHFAGADRFVAYAEAHGLQLRGHALVWDHQLPAWVKHGNFSQAEWAAILREYITIVVRRYRGRIPIWDVVNEPFNGGSPAGNFWARAGDDWIELAFRAAHAADPSAVLVLNDYNIEFTGRDKSDAFYALVRDLKARGVPIHGVGLQAHLLWNWWNGWGVGDVDALRANLQRLAALGLRVELTELDVGIWAYPGSDRHDWQAGVYGAVAGVCTTVPACTGLTVWGVRDDESWVPWLTGQADAPLLFDSRLQPKAAYHAVHAALRLPPVLPVGDEELVIPAPRGDPGWDLPGGGRRARG